MKNKTLTILVLSGLFLVIISLFGVYTMNLIKEPSFCMNCHTEIHRNFTLTDNPIVVIHEKSNLKCLDCHSSNGTKNAIDLRKTLLRTLLFEIIKQPLQKVSSPFNMTYKIDFAPLAANCTKCHTGINTTKIIRDLRRIDADPFSAKILRGPHVNKTCDDCHAANFVPVNCTKCHIPHKKDAQWSYSECVGCHTNPHVPERNGTYTTNISRELCATCHPRQYQLTEIGGGRHKDLACSRCHPVHMTKLNCKTCHGHPKHTFKDENGEKRSQCYMCHGTAGCKDCHPPHTPKLYLPPIETNEQLRSYAIEAHNRTLGR